MIPYALQQLIKSDNDVTRTLGNELANVWLDFSTQIDNTPIIKSILEGKIGLNEYKRLILNMRAQVIDGGSWLSRAASSFDAKSSPLALAARNAMIAHANEEKGDFKMLDSDYCNCGGIHDDIESAQQNIGTFALSSFIMWQASQPNPFGFMGAIFIIEGMGTIKAKIVAEALKSHLKVKDQQVSFLVYHAKADDEHFAGLARFLLNTQITESIAKSIIKTAKTVAFLYRSQLEQLDNV